MSDKLISGKKKKKSHVTFYSRNNANVTRERRQLSSGKEATIVPVSNGECTGLVDFL